MASTTVYLLVTRDKGSSGSYDGLLGFSYLSYERAKLECMQRDVYCQFKDHDIKEIKVSYDNDSKLDIFYIIRQLDRVSNKMLGVVDQAYADLNAAKGEANKLKDVNTDSLYYLNQIVIHD